MLNKNYLENIFDDDLDGIDNVDSIDNVDTKLENIFDDELDGIDSVDNVDKDDTKLENIKPCKKNIIIKKSTKNNNILKNIIINKKIEIEIPYNITKIEIKEIIPIIKKL